MIAFILKIAGAVMIVGGSGLLGKQYAQYLSRRTAVIDGTLKTLRMIREKIQHENELLEICMTSCGKIYPLPEGNLFEEFALQMKDGKEPDRHWKTHVEKYLKRNGMYTESLYCGLSELGDSFDQIHTETLVASMDTTCAFLEEEYTRAEARRAKESPLSWKVSLALGILLTVLLY